MTNAEKPDWREPLYECARSHEKTQQTQNLILAMKEYRFLGDYKDSSEHHETCRKQLEETCRQAQEVIGRTEDLRTLIRETAVLKQFQGVFDCDARLADAQQKKQELYQREERKRRLWRILLAGVILLALLAAIYGILIHF